MLNIFWNNFNSVSKNARIGLLAGAITIVVVTFVLGAWLLRTDYQVLFTNLTPQDAAAMATELERMKVPYQLGENGSAILVEKEAVHKTRMKLMGKDLPLHGAVGFELFNTADFGMTEFAQKVNYQRALQGEITRTILSLSEIEAARVHLALAEEGLFKQAQSKAKASVTLTFKAGKKLRPEQITGIQRLVAAATPNIAMQDVTIIDQHGVALTHNTQEETKVEQASAQLELKKQIENYLINKVDQVLQRTFGAGQAMASVDVSLNMDQVQTTQEEILGALDKEGRAATGVLVRERETVRDAANGAIRETISNGGVQDIKSNGANNVANNGVNTQRENDYQVGRKIEQVVSAPGSIRRIHIVAVVKQALDADRTEQIRALALAAAGASRERGDTVVVQTLDSLGITPSASTVTNVSEASFAADEPQEALNNEKRPDDKERVSISMLWALVLIAIAGAAGLAGIAIGKLFAKSSNQSASSSQHDAMTDTQRQAALLKIKHWLAEAQS